MLLLLVSVNVAARENETLPSAISYTKVAGDSAYSQGKYDEAINMFAEVYDYKDSQSKMKQCQEAIKIAGKEEKYLSAKSLYENKKYVDCC